MDSFVSVSYTHLVYNLDVIISVGYRVKSQRGTQFRVWANKVLKEYLIKGYAVNQQVKIEQLEDLKNTVHLLSNVIEHRQLTLDEANGLLLSLIHIFQVTLSIKMSMVMVLSMMMILYRYPIRILRLFSMVLLLNSDTNSLLPAFSLKV